MGQHTKGDLQQMQSLPLEAKLVMTQRRICDWYNHWNGEVYVAFSGGKDSTVLKHIVDEMYDDVPAVFVNTGLEFPELQSFVRDIKAGKYECFNSDVEIVRPEMRFDEVIKKYGYPAISKQASHAIGVARRNPDGNVAKKQFDPEKTGFFAFSRWRYLIDAPFLLGDRCCYVLKKQPSAKYAKQSGKHPIVGTLANESKLRYSQWLNYGCNAYDTKEPTSHPLSFWTEQDILHYIKLYDVPYCSVYGEIRPKSQDGEIPNQISMSEIAGDYSPDDELECTGYERTGCIYCLYGCHRETAPNRIQRMKTTHPRQYQYCIGGGEYVDGIWQPNKEGLGLGKVMDFIGIPYE